MPLKSFLPFLYISTLFAYSPASGFEHNVKPHCPPDKEVCEFDWVVDYVETMIYYEDGGAGHPIVVRNGSLYQRSSCNTYIPIDISKGEKTNIYHFV